MGSASPASSFGDSSYIDSSTSSYLSPVEAPSRRPNISPRVPPLPPPVEPQAPAQHFPRFAHFPNVVWKADPDVKLKLRKCFYPLNLTILTLGADFNVRTRDVSFRWSWRDRLIGGRLEFFGNQVAITKRFDIDKRSKLDVRAAFDLHTRRTLFSLHVKPFGPIVPHDRPPSGLTIKQRIPVDKRLSVEVMGKLNLPEARFSTETSNAVSLGEGELSFDLQQVNLRFMVQ